MHSLVKKKIVVSMLYDIYIRVFYQFVESSRDSSKSFDPKNYYWIQRVGRACQRYWHPSYCYIIIETRLFEHLLAVRASNYSERAIKRSFKYSSTFDNRMLDFPRRVSLLTGY